MGVLSISLCCLLLAVVATHQSPLYFQSQVPYYYPVVPTVSNPNRNPCWTYPQQQQQPHVQFYPQQPKWGKRPPGRQQQQQQQAQPLPQQSEGGQSNDCPYRCACPFNIDPYCGSNGVTYSNKCELNCAKSNCFPALRISRAGDC